MDARVGAGARAEVWARLGLGRAAALVLAVELALVMVNMIWLRPGTVGCDGKQ